MGVIIQKAGDRINTQELPDLTRVLELYPEYYKQFQEAQDCLMAGDGSLPLQSRYYIAFLAISNSGCDSLISVTIKSFLAAGGDKTWLAVPSAAPAKLQRLRELTEMLWKYPWKITNLNVKSLTVGKDSWTLSEIVQAVVIISHHQSMACFVVGTGQNRRPRERREVRGEKSKQSALRADRRIQLNYLSEFSWDEQGFSLMSSLYSDMANFIDEKLSLHGIQQDDWTGDGVTATLSQDEKIFVENCLFLDLQAEVDLDKLGVRVGYSRKVYLSVIMMESKHQAQLLFFLAAVMKHLS